MQRQHCLLRLRLDRYKAQVRSLYRLAGCFGVSRVGRIALYVGSDELRGDRSNGVSELHRLPAPTMRRPTGFDAHHTRFKLCEMPEYFCAPQLLAHNNVALRIHSVKLQHNSWPDPVQRSLCS